MTAGRPFGKVDIVHLLADRYAYRRYLELATPTTGNYYARSTEAGSRRAGG